MTAAPTTSALVPSLILHGGAGGTVADPARKEAIARALCQIRDTVHEALLGGIRAEEAVVQGCCLLEDDPLFNAGTGSVLQCDGAVRLSASLMSGQDWRFSAVINATRLQNPILLAAHLQGERDHVLSESGAMELARALRLPVHDPLTERRLLEWLALWREESLGTDPFVDTPPTGTIGVVALDTRGRLAAGTSTGGRGFERPGRVSDCAMPAGNYATPEAAVSCTGVGEDIIDESLASRLVVRVEDGLGLAQAFERSFAGCEQRARRLGAIGLDRHGHIAWGKTTEILLAAWRRGDCAGHTLALGPGPVTGSSAP